MPPGLIRYHHTDAYPQALPLATAHALLSPEEKTRAARFHFDTDRHRWIRGRAWIRQELALLLHTSAAHLHITAEPNGRLYLPNYRHLDFNLSHTGPWIALATTTTGRIGLDLETIDPAFPAREIATEYFLPSETAWLAHGPIERFFHLWTAKEALMKATGQGFLLPPNQILVNLQDNRPTSATNLLTGSTHPLTLHPSPAGTLATSILIPHSPP